MLALYRDLIALRRTEPDLADYWLDHMKVDFDEDARWIVMLRGTLAIACNLGPDSVAVPVTGQLLYAWGRAGGRAGERGRPFTRAPASLARVTFGFACLSSTFPQWSGRRRTSAIFVIRRPPNRATTWHSCFSADCG